MPTTTFWNLPVDKRDTLIALAVDEFANNDYNSASLSRIVTRAGIAKGSVYQYFVDKRDLFLFVLDHASRTLIRTVEQDAADDEQDFFQTLRQQMSATTQAALTHPQLARIIERAYLTPPSFMEDVIAQGQALKNEYLQRLVSRGQARGELAADISPDLIITVIQVIIGSVGPFLIKKLALTTDSVLENDPSLFNTPATEEVYDQIIRILRTGLQAT